MNRYRIPAAPTTINLTISTLDWIDEFSDELNAVPGSKCKGPNRSRITRVALNRLRRDVNNDPGLKERIAHGIEE